MNRIRSATRVAPFRLLMAGFLIAAISSAGSWRSARACSTPVFRYAMYNWAAAPYRVFYFHHGQVDEQDAAVNKMLGELGDAQKPANVLLIAVDVTQKEKLEYLPQIVLKSREEHAEGTKPLYLVYTPWGAEVFAGRLDMTAAKAMVDSPLREKLAKLFHKGSSTVMLVLTCEDEKANKRVGKVVRQVAAKAKEGEVVVSSAADPFAPAEFPPAADGEDGEAAGDQKDDGPETMKIGVLTVSRTDKAEQWLVRMLLGVEPDLNEFPKDPMVFAIYGRGRAMPPYIGKGINVENLLDCAMFLAGACSCQVKDQNPGADLLIKWDWDATAEVMAGSDASFAGPFGYQEYAPDVPESPDEAAPEDTPDPAPEDTPEDAPEDTPEDAPTDTPSATDDP